MARVLLMKPIDQEYYIIAPNLGLGYLASSKKRRTLCGNIGLWTVKNRLRRF